MEIKKIQDGIKVVLSLSGRLDTTHAPQLQGVLIPVFDEAQVVELDFTELEYVSSAGLRVLLLGEKTAKMKDVSMTLVNVSEDIMEVFEMVGFLDILKIKD